MTMPLIPNAGTSTALVQSGQDQPPTVHIVTLQLILLCHAAYRASLLSVQCFYQLLQYNQAVPKEGTNL